MSYFLVPNLATLRTEFNQRWPRRDKKSDGWVGDLAHQQRPSGHNPDESGNAERQDSDRLDEVRALDLDKDVDPADGDELFAELDRIRRTPELRRRLIYIIYRRKIASASNGWVWRDYDGDNPHVEHGHVSGHPDYDNSTAPWGVAKEDDMTPAEMLAAKITNPVTGKPATVAAFLQSINREAYTARLTAQAALAAVKGIDGTDETALATELLKVLTPEAIAAALPAEVARQVADELAGRLAT